MSHRIFLTILHAPLMLVFWLLSGTAFANAFDSVGGEHIAVWRPSTGYWYVYNRKTGGVLSQQWGQSGDVPVAADYDGDGTSDFAVWRPSTGYWWVISSKTGQILTWQWGLPNDKPIIGNYKNGHAIPTVWRPSTGTWYALNTDNNTYTTLQWGVNGDIPLMGSHSRYPCSGSGVCLIIARPSYDVWRPSNGVWYSYEVDGKALPAYAWGRTTDKPVSADFNGDGFTDYAIWRPSTGEWKVIKSDFYNAPSGGTLHSQQWGQTGDIPIPNDYDGDGNDDFTVWRPSNGTWYIINSNNGQLLSYQWGQKGDVPVSYYVAPPAPIIR